MGCSLLETFHKTRLCIKTAQVMKGHNDSRDSIEWGKPSSMRAANDFLAHQPARPSTVVPGHWILNHNPTSKIHIHRYVQSAASRQRRSSISVTERWKDDAIERAWHTVNGDGDGDPVTVLDSGCCVVQPGDNGGELWYFSTDDQSVEMDDLAGVFPIDVTD